MKQYIFFNKQYKDFFWSDDPTLLKDESFIHLLTVNETEKAGYHKCKQSVLNKKHNLHYKDNFTDTVQDDDKALPENTKYVINYYEAENEDSLVKKTDFGLTKEDIIRNINNQKYKEGAYYYPL